MAKMTNVISMVEIPGKTVITKVAEASDFKRIKEVRIDDATAELLIAKGRKVYIKQTDINGIIHQIYFVKISNSNFIEFLEANTL